MHPKRREALLKIGALGIAALFVLDRYVLTWGIEKWKEQGQQLSSLGEKVQRGRQLLERGQSLRARWTEMQRTDLADNNALADQDIYKAVSRWNIASRVGFTNLSPQWHLHPDDGYDTMESRGSATGDQASIARLLYEIDADPLPARVNELEITARDAQGKALNLTVRFSFLRLTEKKGRGR